MNEIYVYIQGAFPKAEILLIYRCGSIAYGLSNDSSDQDITVVLDNFKGNIHLNLGSYDVFAFSKERFIQRQQFDPSMISYHLSAADDILNIKEHLIYINPTFQETLDSLLEIDDKTFMLSHIKAEVEYGRMRYELKPNYKSHYHVFRIRGMVDHFDKFGKYELIVEDPWFSKMIEYKNHWNDDIGLSYLEEIKEQLDYLEKHRSELMKDELG